MDDLSGGEQNVPPALFSPESVPESSLCLCLHLPWNRTCVSSAPQASDPRPRLIFNMNKAGAGTKKRKIDYAAHFLDEWLETAEYKSWLTKLDKITAKCKTCSVTFTVRHDDEKAIKTHLNSKKHKGLVHTVSTNQVLTTFLPKKKKYCRRLESCYSGNYPSIPCGKPS
ncbi:hypothetical protein FKM82_012782 [Ascaphus truei]